MRDLRFMLVAVGLLCLQPQSLASDPDELQKLAFLLQQIGAVTADQSAAWVAQQIVRDIAASEGGPEFEKYEKFCKDFKAEWPKGGWEGEEAKGVYDRIVAAMSEIFTQWLHRLVSDQTFTQVGEAIDKDSNAVLAKYPCVKKLLLKQLKRRALFAGRE